MYPSAISFPECTCLLVSVMTRRFGMDLNFQTLRFYEETAVSEFESKRHVTWALGTRMLVIPEFHDLALWERD